MDKKKVFPDNPELYEQWFKENNHLFDSEVEAIRALFPASEEGENIEIGVGTGLFATRLGIKHGIEPAEKMRATAETRGIEVIDAFAEDLPIVDQKYHLALMVTVDCFFDDINKAFEETWRILLPGGFFIIAFIDRKTELGKLYEKNKHENIFYKEAKFHSAIEISEYLTKTGFKIEAEKQTIFTLENIRQQVKDGIGEGVFAVIKAKK